MARWVLLVLVIAAVLVAGIPQSTNAATPAMPVGVYLDGNVFGRDPAVCRSKLTDIKNHHFDAVQWANGWPAQQRDCLIEAENLGIHVTFFPADALYDGWFRNSTVPVTLEAAKNVAKPVIDQLQGTGVDAIQLADELSNTTTNKDKFRLMVLAWQELAPWPVMASHNVTASWWPSVQAYAKPDVWEAFNYPITPSTGECAWINTAAGRWKYAQSNIPAGVPFYAILQSHGADQFNLRAPTVPEVRAQFFAALGSGATGFQWFTYDSQQSWKGLRDAPSLYNEAGDLARRYRAIRANLSGLRGNTNVMQSSNGTIKTFTLSGNGRTFAVLLNTSCSATSKTTLSTSQAGTFTNLEDGTSADKPVVTLRPGDGAVFEFTASTPAPSASPSPTPTPEPDYCGYWWSRYVYPECK